jgi:replicative DNA helicase
MQSHHRLKERASQAGNSGGTQESRKRHLRNGAGGTGYINEEAEKALLTTVLRTNAAYDDVADRIRPEHFGVPLHAQAWEAIGKIVSKGGKAEPATIVSHISAAVPSDCSAEEYLSKKIRLFYRPREELKAFIEALDDAYHGRKIASRCATYGERAHAGEAGLLGMFSADVAGLQGGAPADTFRLIQGDAITALERILDKRRRSRGKITGISTGFFHLDHLLDGLCPSRLIVIGARPKQGKTSFGLAIVVNVAKQGIPVAFFSLEMTRQELVDRMISIECGVDSTRLKRGDFSSEYEWRIKDAVDAVDDLPIYIDDAPGLTPTAILARARRAVAKHGVKLIVVDYLQLVKAENPRASRYEAVTDTSIAIAQMAKSLGVPVIAMAQLSRKLLDRVNFDFAKFKPEQTRPHDGDLRDSGQIEQDAHAVIFLNRPYPIIESAAPAEGGEDFDGRMMAWQEACMKWKRRAEVSVHMNRAGETGTVEFIFKGETSQWEESPSQTYFGGGGLKAPLNFMPARQPEEAVHHG